MLCSVYGTSVMTCGMHPSIYTTTPHLCRVVVDADQEGTMDVLDVTLLDSWAEHEFGDANLGDQRLNRRLVELARTLARRPASSLPHAAQDPALLKAAYRFFDHDDEDFTPDDILASHVIATYDRISSVPLALAVSDTTLLDWSAHPATTGLGPLQGRTHRGLLLHTTLMVTPERLPIGLLQLNMWARPSDHDATAMPAAAPLTQKESQKWLTSLEAVNLAHDAAPQTTLVFVADAEADFYDLLAAPRRTGVEILVRAHVDRRVADPAGHLWAAMQTAVVAGTAEVRVSARPAVPSQYGRPAVPAEPARTAQVQVRFGPQTIKAPRQAGGGSRPDLTVSVVWVREVGAPAGVTPVEWLLLNTLAVETPEAAMERVTWYTCRWGIEVWHKTLKSGCQIEARQLETAERLKRCLALFAVIAWRIVYTTMLGRVAPKVPCTAILDTDEWEALYVRVKRTATLPAQPPRLDQAVRWLGQLGGFVGRKGDGPPGITVLWRGFHELGACVDVYRVMREAMRAAPTRSLKS